MIHDKLVRFIDTKIGKPICFFLYCYKKGRQIVLRAVRKIDLNSVNKILIIKFWGIGSIIQAAPAIKTIRHKFPSADITFLTMDRNRGVFEGSFLINRILYFRLQNFMKLLKDSFVLIKNLRKEHYDLIVDFEIFARYTAIISFLSNPKIIAGYNIKRQGKRFLYDIKAPLDVRQNLTLIFNDLAEAIGANGDSLFKFHIATTETETMVINQILRDIKAKYPIVGMAVGTDFGPGRRWPKEYFAKLADIIIEEYDATVIFIGTKKEIPLVESVVMLMKNKPVNLAGRTTIKELSVLIERCDLFVSNDSGPLHIASMLQIPTVGFFGPADPALFGPIGCNNGILYKKLSCSPCITLFNSKDIKCSKHSECMKSIIVEDALNAVRGILK